MKNTGLIIKELMDSKSISAYELSRETGVSESTIGRIVKGKSKPNKSTLLSIASFMKVPIDYLKTGDKDHLYQENIVSELEINQISGPRPEYGSPKIEDIVRFVLSNQDKMNKNINWKNFVEGIKSKGVIEYLSSSKK